MRIHTIASIAALLLAFGPIAHINAEAQVISAKSTLEAVGKQLGSPMSGEFKKFSATINFDPAKPTDAKVTLEIAMNSYDLGDLAYNDQVTGKNFFDAAKYPTATFVSSSVKPAGAGKYEFAGKLTMKGRTQPVTAIVSYKPDGQNSIFDGQLTIKRLAFGIGEGEWGDISLVADEVLVKFHIVNANTSGAPATVPSAAKPAVTAATAKPSNVVKSNAAKK